MRTIGEAEELNVKVTLHVYKKNLLLLEDIIFKIRKDVGQHKKLGQGDILSLFINDIEKIVGKSDEYSC